MSIRLPQFLSKVDLSCKKMTKDQLQGFIHEIARTLPEVRRDDFLSILHDIAGTTDIKNAGKGDFPEDELSDVNIEALKRELESVNQGEICLDSEYYSDYEYHSDYSPWGNDDEDKFLFSDSQGVLKIFEKAFGLIHKCIDQEEYVKGLEIAEIISSVEITVKGYYLECMEEPFYVKDLFDNDLISEDFEELAKECLYLSYMGNSEENRAEEVFRMMGNLNCDKTTLEDILQMGNEELPGFDSFLKQWVICLATQKGILAANLLAEAQSLIQDDHILLENARKYSTTHPFLFKLLLENENTGFDNGEKVQIGLEALDRTPIDYVVRGEIALITAKYAHLLGEFEVEDNCLYESFRSDSNAMSYMRLRFLVRNPDEYRTKRLEIIKSLYEKEMEKDLSHRIIMDSPNRKNSICKNEYCAFMFWEGQFDEMYEKGMNIKAFLGWSSTFMKEGISLMLLLLYQGEDFQEGLMAMVSRAMMTYRFTLDAYNINGDMEQKSDSDAFMEIVSSWKEKDVIREDDVHLWLSRIEELIYKRTRAIMDRNRRDYYGECAGFIAAFGEVMQSRGNIGFKQSFMLKYKQEYSRRRAFLQELGRFGMKK